ncbi:MAG: hypothetical protein B7Y16_07000 [Methylotenera sp. 24-45-7]|jgi:hypothetical protein|nr:MAG: hypothetical protein B7Y16_07000 [Methylotenera sp. 24-45-7]HQS43952.1 hypothetical protein [Methylotenera sp.]
MNEEEKLNEAKTRIQEKMKDLEHLSHEHLLIYSAVITLELLDRKLEGTELPKGFTLEEYAHRMLDKGIELGKIFQAKINSDKALQKDPRQKAKTYIHDCWMVWQEEPERYEGKASFARSMLNQPQCKDLKSQKKIEDWCREWEKDSHPPS